MRVTAKTGLLAGALFVAAGLVAPGTAAAETANNLVCNGCVNSRDIKKNAVTSAKIRNGSIKPKDLHDSAKPAGSNWVGGDDNAYLPVGVTRTVRTLEMVVPSPGNILVTATWNFYGVNEIGRCSVTTGSVVDQSFLVIGATSNDVNYVPASAVRSFEVEAGNALFNLVCEAVAGAPFVVDSTMVGLFVPATY